MSTAPSSIGVYQVVRELGRGGMGVVYLARDPALDRLVAVKVLSPELAREPDQVVRLRREARTLAQLSHPNIAAIYALDEQEGRLSLVLEFVEGQNLGERSLPLPIDEALSVCAQVASAVEAAHDRSVIHRDLKPGNIRITPKGQVKVLDFGLAKSTGLLPEGDGMHTATVSLAVTRAGALIGTPAYMSPEQARSRPVDFRSDIWSFACILYECLSGKRAFGADNLSDTLAAIIHLQPDWSALPARTPARVRELIKACLAKDAAFRPAGMAVVRQEIEAAISGVEWGSSAVRTPGPIASPFSAVSSLASATTPHNLPEQVTSFVGRDAETGEANRLLRTTRLLTLTGSGGCGKTRLALHAAEELLPNFPGGVWLVELAAVSDAALVPEAAAAALGVKESQGRTLRAAISGRLGAAPSLLILDNCEHVLGACAALADALLRSCALLRILATSREMLGIGGEVTYRVPSLAVPETGPGATASGIAGLESVRLFVERAGAVRPGFALTDDNAPAVAQICSRLDGIPLAVELAAARVRAMTPEQIAERLDDAFRLLTGGSRTGLARHRTLRALIDWSYGLLSDPEKTLLGRLSVFRGGWTIESAEAVGAGGCGAGAAAGTGIAGDEVLELLTRLADKSLVVCAERAGRTRYTLLATVRDYASERLEESGEAGRAHRGHFDHFASIAERGAADLQGPRQPQAVTELDAEHDNIRAAIGWAAAHGTPGEAVRIPAVVWRYWYVRGFVTEGLARAEAALARLPGDASMQTVTALHNAVGVFSSMQGRYQEARAHFESCLARFRGAGDQRGTAAVLNNLALVSKQLGEYDAARGMYAEAIQILRDASLQALVVTLLNNIGDVELRAGNIDAAERHFRECIEANASVGNRGLQTRAEGNLAFIDIKRGAPERGLEVYRRCMRAFTELGDQAGLVDSLWGASLAETAIGRHAHATRLLAAAEALRERIGLVLGPNERPELDEHIAKLKAVMGEDGFRAAWAAGRALTTERAVDLAAGR